MVLRFLHRQRRIMQIAQNALSLVGLLALSPQALRAQTAEDGIMLSKYKFCTGAFFHYDYWDHYWEGSLNRVNGNIGTITTRTVEYTGNFAVTDKLNVLATVPYVYTSASKGVLHGQAGFQDLQLAAKYKLISVPIHGIGALRAIVVLSGSLPMTDYTPDDLPLSIGTHGRQIAGRGTLNYLGRNGLYLNGSSQYSFRGNVQLDRSTYYTNGHLTFSNEVALPNQFEYSVTAGYRKNDTTLTAGFSQQQTRGGGDIRRQDVPFVSNRTNYSKINATLTYPLPRVRDLQYWFLYSNTFNGRNVGQANTFTTGFLYTFDFSKRTGTR